MHQGGGGVGFSSESRKHHHHNYPDEQEESTTIEVDDALDDFIWRESRPATTITEPTDSHNDDDYNPPSSSSTTKVCRWWWWSVMIAVAVVAGVVAGVLYAGSQDNNRNENQPPPAVSLTPTTDDEQSQSEIEQLLRKSSIYDGNEFNDPQSYQSKALQWLEAFALVGKSTEITNEQRIIQLYALACIYFATNKQLNAYIDKTLDAGNTEVRGWVDESGWLTNENECSWKGIACTNDFVREIDLSNNHLSGMFPPEVMLLAESLEVLDLHNNLVYNYGDAGNHFLGQLTKLRYLYLGQTSFEYIGIPPVFRQLTNLVELDVSYTLYFGPIVIDDGTGTTTTTIFDNMVDLEYLGLSGLSFHHEIPAVLGAMPKLRSLYVVNSDVRGSLDDLVKGGNWPTIQELWIDHNPDLIGTIPNEIGSFGSLVSLSFSSNNIGGSLPGKRR